MNKTVKRISFDCARCMHNLVAVVLRCWNITQSFWWDEIWSTMAYATAPSLWQTISSVGYYFNNHMLLFTAGTFFNTMLLGENEIAARLPAVIMGLCYRCCVSLVEKSFLEPAAESWVRCCWQFPLFISITLRKHGATRGLRCLLALLMYFLRGVKTNPV